MNLRNSIRYLSLMLFIQAILYSDPSTPQNAPQLLTPQNNEVELYIHNRPLVKVKNHVISLLDVVKKMKLFLFHHKPELLHSKFDQYHFFMTNWEKTLEEMIHNELIVLEAKEKKITISDGEIGERMHQQFGPNLTRSFTLLNITEEEARNILEKEMIVEKMHGYKIHNKTFQSITPQLIKSTYQKYLQDNPGKKTWVYQTITIPNQKQDVANKLAHEIYTLLHTQKQSPKEAQEFLTKKRDETGVTISVSKLIEGEEQNLSNNYRAILTSLASGECSKPMKQTSRAFNGEVYRIFYVKECQENKPASFDQMYETIQEQLVQERFQKEMDQFLKQLYKKHAYNLSYYVDQFPEDYMPFELTDAAH